MPFYLQVDISALGFSTVLATALILLVIGSWAKDSLSRYFAAWVLVEAIWAICSLLLRLALWFNVGNPLLLAEIATHGIGFLGPLLFLFACRYVGCSRSWSLWVGGVGLLLIALLAFPLYTHRLVSEPLLEANGSTTMMLSGFTYLASMITIGFMIWSLILFLRHNRQHSTFLWVSVSVLAIGVVTGGLLELPFPILSITNTSSMAILGIGIANQQLFNPLRSRTKMLEKKVEERTRDLQRAMSGVEAIVTERTNRMEMLAQLGRRTTAILEPEDLLREAAQLIKNTFDYYMINILLLEDDNLFLKATTFPGLEQMIGVANLDPNAGGIVRQVIDSGKSWLAPNVRKDPHYISIQTVPTKSELCVPLKTKGIVIGALDAQSTERDAFSDDDVYVLQTVADQLAVAIENARLYRETRDRAERLAVVNRIANTVGQSLELNTILETVYTELNTVFQSDAFFIALHDEEAEALDVRLQFDEGEKGIPERIPLGTGYTSEVVRTREALLIKDTAERSDLQKPKPWGTMKLPRSWLGVPMKAGAHLVGIINVQAYRPNAYGEEEQTLLTTIADQISLAIQNARLYETVQSELAERRKTEEELRESEEHFRNLAEQSPNMIFINARGRIVYANSECIKVMGYDREQLYGADFDFFHLIAEDSKAQIKENHAQHQQIRDVGPNEYTLRTKTGGLLSAIITTKLINYWGETAVLGIVTDISDRKRTENLLTALNQAALTMEQSLDPEAIFAAAGTALKPLGFECSVFLLDENEKNVTLGYHSHTVDAEKRDLFDRFQSQSLPLAVSPVLRSVVHNQQAILVAQDETGHTPQPDIQVVFQRLVSDLLAAKSIVAPLILEENTLGVIAVQQENLSEEDLPTITAFANQMAAAWRKAKLMKDLEQSLTELKQTQEQLLQAQKMEAVGQLAGGVAHDFNNILTAISGYAELLILDYAEQGENKMELFEIRRATEQAARLTRQLLAFSRKQVLKPEIVFLNDTVTEVQMLLGRLIGEDIKLHTALDPDVGQIRVDPVQLEQVILNLAVNARDAMPQGGELTLETRNIELDSEYSHRYTEVTPGSYVQLAVSDTGIGMDVDTQNRLFEPFFTTKEHGKGTGLGMSTVYGIVKQSNGHISVHSEPKQGTTVKIHLPRIAAPEEPVQKHLVPGEDLHGLETILLVEDDRSVRALTSKVLKRFGYTILEAADARAAIGVFEQSKHLIDLLLTDVIMPGGMSGRDLTETLRQTEPELKVLYMSGYTDDAIVHHGVLDSEVNFIHKPFKPEILIKTVRDILDQPKSI